MRADGASKWYIGAALASVVVLVAGWFLLISPQRSSAEEIGLSADEKVAANVATQRQIDSLKAQYKDLPQLEQQLAAMRVRIPNAPNMPSVVRSVSTRAATAGVKIESLVPSAPQPLAVGNASSSEESLTTPGQVNQIPVVVSLTGRFANMRLFISSLESLQRSFLVTGVDVARSDDTTLPPGTLTATITGSVFTANEGTPVTAKADTTTTAATTTAS